MDNTVLKTIENIDKRLSECSRKKMEAEISLKSKQEEKERILKELKELGIESVDNPAELLDREREELEKLVAEIEEILKEDDSV